MSFVSTIYFNMFAICFSICPIFSHTFQYVSYVSPFTSHTIPRYVYVVTLYCCMSCIWHIYICFQCVSIDFLYGFYTYIYIEREREKEREREIEFVLCQNLSLCNFQRFPMVSQYAFTCMYLL